AAPALPAVTKADEAEADAVTAHARRLNPAAEVGEAAYGDVEPRLLFGRPQRDPRELALEQHDHTEEVAAFCLFVEEQLDWTAFGIWLTMLLQARGADLLRVKGLLDVGGPGPL